MTQAIILAAGQGTRLRPLTDQMPKCMIEFDGVSLLERQVAVLNLNGIKKVSVVSGFAMQIIQEKGFACIQNPNFLHSNMVESLFCAEALMTGQEDIIITYGDIIYESVNLKQVIETKGDVVVMVDAMWKSYWELRFDDVLSDAESMKINDDKFIVELGQKTPRLEDIQGQFTGLIKISANKVRQVCEFYTRLKSLSPESYGFSQMYMTDFIQLMINHNWRVKAAMVNHGWLEFDSISDLSLYQKMHAENQLKTFFKG